MKFWIMILTAAAALAAAESPAVTRARQELERVRVLVGSGALAPAKLAEAQQSVEDAADQAVLEQTLYGHIRIEDLRESEAGAMVSAAERRLDRQRQHGNEAQNLVAAGVAAPTDFKDLEAELNRRQLTLDQAKTRAALLLNIMEMARAEIRGSEERSPLGKAEEHVEGDHPLGAKDVKSLTLAFEKQFDKPLPVSARGSTAVHRAMGFDHTGRIDVAVNPDAAEGIWLRKYLERKDIPYYAFRAAIPGKATAPHIHIGPGSTRFHVTD